MAISLSIFLYLYYASVMLWALFSLVGIYHIVKFSQIGLVSLLSVIIYVGGSLGILNLSYYFLSQVDWEAPVAILGGAFKIGSF